MLAKLHSMVLTVVAVATLSSLAAAQTCPKPCWALPAVTETGSIDPGDGVFTIAVVNYTHGTGTDNCQGTCILCRVDYQFTFAMYNEGQYCLTIETPAGSHSFPPEVDNYVRPGVLESKCNPQYAPFFTGKAKNCDTGVVQKEITIALGCECTP